MDAAAKTNSSWPCRFCKKAASSQLECGLFMGTTSPAPPDERPFYARQCAPAGQGMWPARAKSLPAPLPDAQEERQPSQIPRAQIQTPSERISIPAGGTPALTDSSCADPNPFRAHFRSRRRNIRPSPFLLRGKRGIARETRNCVLRNTESEHENMSKELSVLQKDCFEHGDK